MVFMAMGIPDTHESTSFHQIELFSPPRKREAWGRSSCKGGKSLCIRGEKVGKSGSFSELSTREDELLPPTSGDQLRHSHRSRWLFQRTFALLGVVANHPTESNRVYTPEIRTVYGNSAKIAWYRAFKRQHALSWCHVIFVVIHPLDIKRRNFWKFNFFKVLFFFATSKRFRGTLLVFIDNFIYQKNLSHVKIDFSMKVKGIFFFCNFKGYINHVLLLIDFLYQLLKIYNEIQLWNLRKLTG